MKNLETLLSIKEWNERIKKHERRVSPYADAFLQRRSSGLKHAVHDFLFTYYSFSPAKLKQWIPSFEESLVVTSDAFEEHPWFNSPWFSLEAEVLSLNLKKITPSTLSLAQFIADLSDNILNKPPRFSCFGLHEWAMVYKLSEADLRHKGYNLRLAPDALATFVESQTISCSHYDAYRFFTEEARPLNVLKPTLETRLHMEQGGCLHANMDLYKWSVKLWPWIGSDFLAKAFSLAIEGRELDMRASPYDLRDVGYLPLCIETEEGRKQYQKEQQLFAERSFALRKELSSFCKRLILQSQINIDFS